MKMVIVLFVVWFFVSQVIAWMITPSKDEDTVTNTWFTVFILPVALVIIVLEWASDKVKKRLTL